MNSQDDFISRIYPKDPVIPLEDIIDVNPSRFKNSLKIVNNQVQCEEAYILQNVIEESGDSSYKYFKSKKSLPESDLKKLEKIHSS